MGMSLFPAAELIRTRGLQMTHFHFYFEKESVTAFQAPQQFYKLDSTFWVLSESDSVMLEFIQVSSNLKSL